MPEQNIDISCADELIDLLTKIRDGEPTLVDIMAMAELLASTLQPYFRKLDTTLYSELRQIAQYIEKTKDEIGSLQANHMSEERIPEAGMELSAVVDATESATHSIMESAETLMAADTTDVESYNALVNQEVMNIFEACSFQDITGQRISKVVETLEFIDARISRFANTFGVQDKLDALTKDEKRREERKQKNILHGPQRDGDGVGQDDVDALFAEADNGSTQSGEPASQDDIDALFH